MADMRTLSYVVLLGVVLGLTAWVYWPGHTGPGLLDDRPSVLKIQDLKGSPELALDYILGERSGPLGRPVSMTTFVLERLYLDGSLATSKKVNILLHLGNGLLVIWLLCLILRHRMGELAPWLALVLGAIWLLAPLFVSTVLYVVQRMAMLSTTFMLLAVIAYCYWRESLWRGRSRHWLAGLVLAAFLLALFAKENAVVLVPILLLLEALWYRFEASSGQPVAWLRNVVLVLIAGGAVGLAAFFTLNYGDLAGKYHHRPFTLEERLLTQPRVLWDYVRQFYWPDVSRMGIYHDDVVVSRSLTDPPSTSLAIMGWIAVALLALWLLAIRRGQLLLLGVAVFLVGHAVESTVLPLELYFEHRNYFPSLGLLLLLAAVFGWVVHKLPQTTAPLLVYLACFALWLASLTSSQVQIWSSRPLLAFSHVTGHPDSFRANTDMAVLMASLGDYGRAREYSERAYAVSPRERASDYGVRDLALACMAGQAVPARQIAALAVAGESRPLASATSLLVLVRMLQSDYCPDFPRDQFARRMAEVYLAPSAAASGNKGIYLSLALLENTLSRYDEANQYIDRYLELAPGSTRGLLMKLHFLTALDKGEERVALLASLQQLEREGKLSVHEQQTLALYLEN
jgi:hypothetical protein